MVAAYMIRFLLVLCAVSSVLGASYNFLPPSFTDDTVPFLQFQATINRTLKATAATTAAESFINHPTTTSSYSSSSSFFSTVYGVDGSGIFLTDSGSLSSRRRAVDGMATWTADNAPLLPQGSSCSDPFLPLQQANHLYVLCTPNIIVKRWFDTGALQFAVRVTANATVALAASSTASLDDVSLTQIVGLSDAFDPPALLLGSSTSGVLIAISSKNGTFLGQFGNGPISAGTFKPTPKDAFVSFSSIRGFIPSPVFNSDQLVLVAEVNTAASKVALIAFRLQLPAFTVTADGFYQVITADEAAQGSTNSITVSTNSHRVYVRTAQSLSMVSWTTAWTTQMSIPELFPYDRDSNLIETNDGNIIYPDQLQIDQTSGRPCLIGLDVSQSTPFLLPPVDFSGIYSPSSLPVWITLDPKDNLILVNSVQISVASKWIRPFIPTTTPTINWAYIYYELYDEQDVWGSPSGFETIATVELPKISRLQLVPDRMTNQLFLVVTLNSTTVSPTVKDVSGKIMQKGGEVIHAETMLAFYTHVSPSCNDTVRSVSKLNSSCVTCENISGSFTARQCGFCVANGGCSPFYGYLAGYSNVSSQCSDVDFPYSSTDPIALCASKPVPPYNPDDDGGSSRGLLAGLIGGVAVILIIVIGCMVYHSRRSSSQRTVAQNLKSHYQSLSPDASFSRMRATSPRHSVSSAPSPAAHLQREMVEDYDRNEAHSPRTMRSIAADFNDRSPILGNQIQ